MEDLATVFIVMMRNGSSGNQCSDPIQSCSDRRDAESLAVRKNLEVARLDGKIEARTLMMDHFRTTHPRLGIEEYVLELSRFTSLLGIQTDCEALGFSDENAIDGPNWSVVEVPHGMP